MIQATAKEDETLDEIRGIKILQKRKGYRFSSDSIVLADFPDLSGVEKAVDLGTGSGVIAILLARRSERLKVIGIELQPSLYDLAVRNVLLSSLSERVEIVQEDIRRLRNMFECGGFDLVVSNPPYFKEGKGRVGPNTERTTARHEVSVKMEDIMDASEFLLREGGRVVVAYPADRRYEVVSVMRGYGLGPTRIMEVHGKDLNIVVLEGKKGYSGAIFELPPLSP